MNYLSLEEIHEIELKIVSDIDRVCRKNGIKYTIIGGTLIGAVRHGGFIPWDDDIDIAICRSDYDKFIKIYSKEKGNDFSIFEYRLNNEYYYPFIKVSYNLTSLSEYNYLPIKNLGVNLDIFPVDLVSNKNLDKKLKKIEYYRKALSSCFSIPEKVQSNPLKRLFKRIYYPFSYSYYLKKIDKMSVFLGDSNECELAGVLVNGTGKKDLFKKSIFDEYTDIKFENLNLMAVKDYTYFLEHRFGDYMKMPPKDQQVAHPSHSVWKKKGEK